MNDEVAMKYVRIPIWLASILAAAILGFGADTWRTVQRLDRQLACLRTELAAKGIIDSKVIAAESVKLPDFSNIKVNQLNQQW